MKGRGNEYLSTKRPREKFRAIGEDLPIHKYKNQILDEIKKNQVVIISGETGCGKTTQVPKFIYYDAIERNANINILITQPRRIAAVSIAKRLSKELDRKVGEVVGYHVGMNPVFSDATKILIVTTGIFLQRIIHEKHLDDFTHVILDEVHERDIDIDFVLVLIKHILFKNKKIKLILMSATISTNLFANYFSASNINNMEHFEFYKDNKVDDEDQILETTQDIDKTAGIFKQNDTEDTWCNAKYGISTQKEITWENKNSNMKPKINFQTEPEPLNVDDNLVSDHAPIINIPNRTYPVTVYHSENIITNLKHRINKDMNNFHLNFDKKQPRIETFSYELCFHLITEIVYKDPFKMNENNVSILVFLPGVGEINTMNNYLLDNFHDLNRIDIYHLHSNLQE